MLLNEELGHLHHIVEGSLQYLFGPVADEGAGGVDDVIIVRLDQVSQLGLWRRRVLLRRRGQDTARTPTEGPS